MNLRESFRTLVHWCRETPMDAGVSLVEPDYWGFCASRIEGEETREPWFAWFPTRDAMLRYFADCWPFDYHDEPEALERDSPLLLKAARFGVAVRRYDAGELEEDLFLAILSDAHPGVTVEWVGTLGDLFDGEGTFAREWRADFRGMDVLEGDDPLEPDEMDDALRALAWDA